MTVAGRTRTVVALLVYVLPMDTLKHSDISHLLLDHSDPVNILLMESK